MIARETVERVREHTDLVALVGETVKLTRRGRSWVGLCPFHKEKSPSFHVSPERGYFHCFGCKESGSAIDFVMKTEGLAFVEAVRQLAERAGIEIEETRTVAERKHEEAARRDRDELYGVLAFAATYFEHCLRGGPASPFAGAPHPYASLALRALEERGLSPSGDGGDATSAVDTALQAFRVGYAPFGWEGLARTLTKQGLSLSVAEKVGLIVPRAQGSGRGHYDRFRHRLMFAVLDVQGRVVAFSGRALPEPGPAEVARIPEALRGRVEVPDGRAGEPPAKYLNSPESPVYTKGQHLFGLFQARHAIRRAGEALLVEGNFDVVALHARGIENVVAPLGTAFTDEQAALLRRFAPKVVLMFDADAAGRKATYAARVPARAAGLSVRVADLPAGMDPDELARKRGAEAVTRAAKEAAGLLEHLIDKALDELGMEAVTLDGQLRRVRKVAELLAEEADPELRTLAKAHADRLSSKLAVGGAAPLDLRQLERMLERALQAGGAPDEPTHEGPTGPAARSSFGTARIQEELLGALVDAPELVNDPEVRAELDVLEGDTALALAALRRLVDARGAERFGLYASDFLAQVPHSIQGFVVARMAAPRFESPSDAKWGALANARKLKRRSLVRENEPEKHDLARAIAEGDTARAALIAREMSERARLRERLGH
jgi:DNA primase